MDGMNNVVRNFGEENCVPMLKKGENFERELAMDPKKIHSLFKRRTSAKQFSAPKIDRHSVFFALTECAF